MGNLPAGMHMMNDSQDMNELMGNMDMMLRGKTGDEFDKSFLAQMIVHHQGAVQMAEAALQNAKHDELKSMSRDIISAQNREISQMKGWQDSWYGLER
ncbi:MAG: DUF305 domain-containing protein [Nanoarchaeota archaeon]|nr:DUF305 domain-containing protein [Nanoarchaeota archaeon]